MRFIGQNPRDGGRRSALSWAPHGHGCPGVGSEEPRATSDAGRVGHHRQRGQEPCCAQSVGGGAAVLPAVLQGCPRDGERAVGQHRPPAATRWGISLCRREGQQHGIRPLHPALFCSVPVYAFLILGYAAQMPKTVVVRKGEIINPTYAVEKLQKKTKSRFFGRDRTPILQVRVCVARSTLVQWCAGVANW